MSGFAYAFVCPIAYLLAGSLKFAINSLRVGTSGFGGIGLGGFPSTHTSIVSSSVWLIAIRAGIDTPAFAVSLGLLLVVVIDAMDLRRKLGHVNRILKAEFPNSEETQRLRDRTGHTPIEVAGGIIVGAISALLVNVLSI